MICRNKDFLKEVLSGTKDLMPLDQVRRVNMPYYDELSVRDLWPQMRESPKFMMYFPSKFPKGRQPDRAYFFNIMNTLMGDYVQQIIKHANAQRHSAANEAMAG